MKLMKRALALLLSFLILTNSGPLSAFATEGVSDNDVVVETTAPVACTVCGIVDCQSTHEAWCDTCKVDSCGIDHTTPAEDNGSVIDEEVVGCSECKQAEGHAETCSQYVAPVAKCEYCGIELIEDAVHLETCLTLCTCEPVEGVHQEGCKFYEAPIEEISDNAPQVGDKIWIKAGSKVYKNHNNVDKDYYELRGNYEIKVVEILTDETGAAEWYKFEFTNLGIGEIALSIGGYKYVHVDNTSVEEPSDEPVDENACNCGENAPENIADHADSCPRKAYIKTLFEGKTAEEIYANWDSYDEATQTDLLNMLQKWDNTKYEELKKLVDKAPDGETEASVGENSIFIQGVPEDVLLTVNSVSESEYHESLNSYIDSNSELLFVYDITLKNPDGSEWQPANGHNATITLDFNGTGFADGNVLSVLHEHDGELRELGDYAIEDGKLTFTTDGFSKFYFYITYTFGEQSFTMSGGSTVYLSEILRELSVSYSIGDVANVQFTNPDVLKIIKAGSDWKLESLAPFGSEETLTITFSNGEVIEIIVKDPVIFNYAVGSNITNVAQLATKSRKFDDCNNGDNTPCGKTYTTSSVSITNAELIAAAGSAASVNIIIYAKPGMAIGFEAGTTWGTTSSEIGFARPTATANYIWYWSWIRQSSIDSNYSNYVFVKDNTAGQQDTFKIQAVSGNSKVTVNVTLCSVAESSPTLLEENLPSGYSLKNVPVTLYNYDGNAFNANYNGNGQDYFAFSGYSMGENAVKTNAGWNSPSGEAANAGGSVAMMGIVKEDLVNGLPVMSKGQNVDLFSTNAVNGKTVYDDVQFQFVYNEKTGYYTYNSALNHAQYNSSTNTIQLYKQSLAPADTANGDAHGNAGFYPFEDIKKAYTNTAYTAISQETWISKIENSYFELTPAQYSADIVTTSSKDPASTVDMHYGIQIASDFYMPKGKQLNGQDMIYKFTGDDDLWVFIDGKLVLDIGGGHTHVSGSFNLTTGEVWVEQYTQLDAASGGSYETEVKGTNLRYTDTFLTGLKDDQMHTIQVFYLERHSGVSNCYMHFNLPLVPSDAVNVSKNLVNQDGEELSVTPDVDYTFTLMTATDDDDNVDATSFTAKADYPYTVKGAGAPTETQKTDADGQFKLKDGWIASFQGIDRFTEVYVIESKPEDGYQYTEKGKVSVNKAASVDYEYGKKTETKIMQLNQSINFDFTNYMQTQPLTIEKKVVNGTEGLTDSNQKFEFTLDFTKGILETGTGAISATDKSGTAVALTDGGTFKLGHNESVTIPRVPVNMTFTLKETNPDSTNGSFDAPKFTFSNCTTTQTPNAFDTAYTWTVGNGDANKVVVTNQQRFNLTIRKNGIQSVDHDSDEQQSTIYTVVGKIGNTEIVKMDVAICGNDFVTICKLPVGTYTVEENTDWSWRYDSVDKATKNVSIPEDAKATVDYVNNRTENYWLSGDCYVENWWNDNSIKKRNGKDEVIE